MIPSAITKLDKTWRAAWDTMRATDRVQDDLAERYAWDEMRDARNTAGLCPEPDCPNTYPCLMHGD